MKSRINLSVRLLVLNIFIFGVMALLLFLPEYDGRIKATLVIFAGGITSVAINRFVIKPILGVVDEARNASIEVVKADLNIKLLNEKLENIAADNMRLNASLRKKNEDMEALLYTISHDLRTPLAGIEGYVGLLAEKNKNSGLDVEKYISKIKESSDFMGTMIKSLLELSRIERAEEKSSNVDVAEIVEKTRSMLSFEFSKKKIRFQVNGILLPVYGRANRLQEVFQNLIQNASKFNREIEDAYIEVGSKKIDEGFVEYWVKDNGIGIDFEEQGKIFMMFYKVKETGRDGFGVGLAIVKKIVESHGGRLKLESRKGYGSAFYFTLPTAK